MAIVLALLMACFMPMREAASATESLAVEEAVQPSAFSRSYTQFYAMNARMEVMRDVNWYPFDDTTVSVAFKSTEGPDEFTVEIWYKANDAASWTHAKTASLSLCGAMSCNIPQDVTFIVMAEASSGSSGNAALQISIS